MLVTKAAETNKMKWGGGNLASKSSQSIYLDRQQLCNLSEPKLPHL